MPKLFFILFIIGSILLFILSGYILKLNTDIDTKLSLIFQALSAISIIIIIYNIYLSTEFSIKIEKNKEVDNTLKEIEDSYLTPQYELINLYPESYFFYRSINPSKKILTMHEPKTYDETKKIMIDAFYSNKIFQIVENIISGKDFTSSIDDVSWTNTFLAWFHSDILQEYWINEKEIYAPETRKYIDLLIKNINIIKKNKITDSKELDKISISINNEVFAKK